MNIREALRTMSPSKALLDAARDEIARLDAILKRHGIAEADPKTQEPQGCQTPKTS